MVVFGSVKMCKCRFLACNLLVGDLSCGINTKDTR